MSIELNDLKARWGSLENSLAFSVSSEIEKSFENASWIQGREVALLECELAQTLKAPMVKTCASGTDALWLALELCDLSPGDEVILPPVTFAATLQAILRVGAVPVFADVDSQTWTLSPADVVGRINSKTKAIIAVNIAGVPAELPTLYEMALANNLILIEDNAQGLGTEIEWKPTSQYCHLSTLSFFPTKNLGGMGDGGALVVSHDFINRCVGIDVRERLDILCNQGLNPSGQLVGRGWNSRLDSIQAIALLKFLPQLKTEYALRQNLRARYAEYFEALGDEKIRFRLQEISEDVDVHFSLMPVWVDQGRDDLVAFLNSRGVMARVYYAPAIHMQPLMTRLGGGQGSVSLNPNPPKLDVAEKLVEGWFFLPFHAHLSESDLNQVFELILEWRDSYV